MEWIEQSIDIARNIQQTATTDLAGLSKLRKRVVETAARERFHQVFLDYSVDGTILTGKLIRIYGIVNSARWPELPSGLIYLNWKEKLDYVGQGRGLIVPVSVICDLFLQDQNKKRYAFFFRDSLRDRQSSEQKAVRDLLVLHFMRTSKIDEIYFVIHGMKESPPKLSFGRYYPGLFRETDPVILTDREFWDQFLS